MSKCRACLKSMKNMIPFNENYIMYFNILTNLDLQLSCDNPQLLCKRCFKTFQQFIEFREKCIAANAEFTNTSTEVKSQETRIHISKDVKQEDGIIIIEFEDNNTEYNWEGDEDKNYGSNLKYELDYNTEAVKSETKDIKIEEENIIKCNKTSEMTRLLCGLCNSSFEDKTQLHSHLQTHKDCSKCPVCAVKFADWQEAIAHRLTHLQEKRQQCHLCQLEFKTVLTMERHLRTAHHIEGKTKTLRCKKCDKMFKTQKRLREHAKKHSDKHYYCDFCKKLFLNKCSLRKHLASHADKESGTFKCEVCDFVCKNKGNLTIHQLHKHKVETREVCNSKKSYVKKDGSVCKVKAVLCPVCGKILTNSSYQRHMHSHDVEGWFQCKFCPARFKWRQSLLSHQDKHAGVPRYACEYCPARFYFPSVLVKHRRVHTGERPYVCDICHKAFTGGSNLKLHMRVHGKYLINKRNDNEPAEAAKPFYQLKT